MEVGQGQNSITNGSFIISVLLQKMTTIEMIVRMSEASSPTTNKLRYNSHQPSTTLNMLTSIYQQNLGSTRITNAYTRVPQPSPPSSCVGISDLVSESRISCWLWINDPLAMPFSDCSFWLLQLCLLIGVWFSPMRIESWPRLGAGSRTVYESFKKRALVILNSNDMIAVQLDYSPPML